MDEEVAAPKEVAGYNAAAAATSANANILHDTSTTNNNENEYNDIGEVHITPPNQPTELISVNAGSDGDHNQEDQDENPVDTLSQNQDTTAMPDTTAINDRTAGDNPNGAVEMEDAEEENDSDDSSDSEDDDNITKGSDNRYPRSNRKKKDTYEPSYGGQQYSNKRNPMLIQNQGYNAMPENEKDNFIQGIIMTQYILKRVLKELGSWGLNAVKKEHSQMYNMHTFIPKDLSEITREMRKNIYCFIDVLERKNKWRRKGQSICNGSKQRTYIKK